MGNRKAISSDDFMFDDSQNAAINSRVQEMKSAGVTQISSDMMFGRASAPEQH